MVSVTDIVRVYDPFVPMCGSSKPSVCLSSTSTGMLWLRRMPSILGLLTMPTPFQIVMTALLSKAKSTMPFS